MYYSLIVLLVWLLLGAKSFSFGFNSTFIAFLIAVIVDLVQNRGVFIKR